MNLHRRNAILPALLSGIAFTFFMVGCHRPAPPEENVQLAPVKVMKAGLTSSFGALEVRLVGDQVGAAAPVRSCVQLRGARAFDPLLGRAKVLLRTEVLADRPGERELRLVLLALAQLSNSLEPEPER